MLILNAYCLRIQEAMEHSLSDFLSHDHALYSSTLEGVGTQTTTMSDQAMYLYLAKVFGTSLSLLIHN